MEPWWFEEEPSDYSLHIKVLLVTVAIRSNLNSYVSPRCFLAEASFETKEERQG